MPSFSRALLLATCAGGLLASCAAPAERGSAATAHAAAPSPFTPCPDAADAPALAGTECARIEVPLDHAAPQDGTQDGAQDGSVELFVRKFPADGAPQGELWLVAGGPGESGASFYPFLDTLRAAAPGYDLLIPDHRGTGYSARLCPAEESADSPGGTALVGAEWGSCFGALNADAARTRAFTITNAAHDLSQLMERLGSGGETWLYGVSYGTQLVLRTMAIDPPAGVDGVILDSLVPPEDTERYDLSRRSGVVDAVGRTVLAEEQQDDLAALVEEAGPDGPLGPRPKYLLGALLDLPETRAMLPRIVAGLKAGDTRPLGAATARLEALGARFAPYPQAPSSIPLVSLISRAENNARPGLTAEQIAAEEEGYLFASPLPGQLLQGGFPAYRRGEHFARPPASLPPTLVLHGTLDPKTPYAGAREHISRFTEAGDTRLLTVEGAPHFILMTAPDCFRAGVGAVLRGDSPPTTCSVETSVD
ncbi:hypothetical protein B5C34_05810 [Pacificimonas flava]|uniref:AB hydrolase-1 domain-containing protein n=2 Tax=Pacificimonas TaxID=1960290 RepID=A0A219B4C6_9SPHN|nr:MULTISPECIES: alpha/beta hydrolase [Pacificimonas]MBZ6377262.1 alpha/beta hydrolase [Pacificimonas aurantium]OWV33024.1 hypothetical protein B5C34_05810 [Pacificimonas flava]